MEQTYMKERPVVGLVLAMSLPMMLSMTVSSLYNIVDSYYVAALSEDALTALSLVYPLQNLITAVTIGFSVGINAAIAYFLGAGETDRAARAAGGGLWYSTVHGVVLAVGCIAVLPAFLGLFTRDAAVAELGVRYGRIAFAFAPVVAWSMALEKMHQAAGRMVGTMLGMLCGCVSNIVLDPVLIFGLGPFPAMGIEGAALATGIGQTLGFAFFLGLCRVRPLPMRVDRAAFRPDRDMARTLYGVGVPAALNMALPSALVAALNVILAADGQVYVLALGVYYKLQTFLYLPANGIVQGMRPLIGYNYGAGESARVRSIYRVALAMAGAIMAAGTVVCWAAPGELAGLFSRNPATVAAGARALRIISLGFLVSAVSVISCGALEGLGMGGPSFAISALRCGVILIPAALVLDGAMGPEGVWHAFWITEAVTAACAAVIYRCALRRGRRAEGKHPPDTSRR